MLQRLAYALLFAFAAVAILPAQAEAYCRGVTERPPLGHDPTRQGCFVGSGAAKQLYWKSGCVGYSVTRAASAKVTLEQATRVASDAFAAWTAAGCDAGPASIEVVNGEPVECGLVEYNRSGPNQNLIVFRDDGWPYSNPDSALALTTITFDTGTGEIFDADIEINSAGVALVVDGPMAPGSFDLESILTHEAGHFLGLGHSDDRTAIMFAHYQAGARLVPDDDSGLCSIYSADGTRSTSGDPVPSGACDPTPRHGFSTECGSLHPGTVTTTEPETSSTGGCSIARRGSDRDVGAVSALLALVAGGRLRPRRRWVRESSPLRVFPRGSRPAPREGGPSRFARCRPWEG